MQNAFINQGIEPINQIIKHLNAKKIFFIVGNSAYGDVQTYIEPFISQLSFKFFNIGNSKIDQIILGCASIKKYKPDLVVSIGGGRVIDAAKLIVSGKFNDGNFLRLIKGEEIIDTKMAPLLVLPTTAGTGSESTSFSVIYYGEKKYSVISNVLLPDFVVADCLLVKKMPSYLKACSLFDAFSQSIESYWSVGANKDSRENSERAMKLISKNFKTYLKKDDTEITKEIVEAAYYSGKAINISKTTLPHALSYFLTIKYNIAHGHAVAVILGLIGRLNYKFGDKILKSKMMDICEILEINANDFESYWTQLLKISNLENKLSKLGVHFDDLQTMVDVVNIERLKNHPINFEKSLLLEELKRIY